MANMDSFSICLSCFDLLFFFKRRFHLCLSSRYKGWYEDQEVNDFKELVTMTGRDEVFAANVRIVCGLERKVSTR